MSSKKRLASQIENDAPNVAFGNKRGPDGKRATNENEDMGDFEDEWEDEVDREEDNEEENKSENNDGT